MQPDKGCRCVQNIYTVPVLISDRCLFISLHVSHIYVLSEDAFSFIVNNYINEHTNCKAINSFSSLVLLH